MNALAHHAPAPAQEGKIAMEAPKVRLAKVLTDTSTKLDRLLPKDRANLRAAFDQALAETTDAEGVNDGGALLGKMRTVTEACPDEGPAREAMAMLLDRLHDEVNYRGREWCRVSLALTLKEHIKVFGEDVAPKLLEDGKKSKSAHHEKQ